ncbi:hypothetical protein K457DRAFT_68527 [Linnemannia elongata AG-77]|uniref:Pentatricopeptide repeat-containing protein-mitochondrial domain-containing protein n=1 Tax=Linnemannia elongata AG-77 TaxID=1314771 RepID=A0A197KB00_9FUNG|nr:hypothetical protein K457DRAFT_68527 [Linnemannia elongata AG-77]
MFIPRNQLCGIVHSGIHARVASTAVTTRHATITCLRQTHSSFHTSSGPRSSIPTSHYNPFISSNTPRHRIPGARGIITGTYPSTPLNKYNHKLITLLRDPQTCLPIFDKCREIQELNLKPDLTTYTVLLEAHERNNDLESIMRTLEEMELVGISPSISAFNIALRAAGSNGDTVMLEKITELIRKAGLQMNINSYEIIIQGLCANSELEHALDILGDMTVSVDEEGQPDENGRPTIDVRPSLQCFVPIIQLAQSLHETETAYLVLKMAEVQAGLARIPAVVYTDLMARAADDYLPAVEYCWKKGVKELGACPDEGSCMLVLNCAAHEKAPQLSAEVIQYMGENDMDFQEYHFAPLLQAFSLAGKYKSAFNVLSIMRTSGMKPTILTATSLLKVLDEQGNINDAYTCMREMHQEGKAIDVVAFNVLIEACGRAKNLTQAMSIFDAAASLSIKPDTDTYNALLTGCITDRNMSEGKNVILMMQKEGVDPNVDTYQSLITLCLTQINYEDAFMYLEEMKSHDVIPSESIYTSLVRKLARENDPRIKYAVEEMESFGYVVGPNLREYIETGGLSNLEESERRKQIRVAQRRRSSNRPHF